MLTHQLCIRIYSAWTARPNCLYEDYSFSCVSVHRLSDVDDWGGSSLLALVVDVCGRKRTLLQCNLWSVSQSPLLKVQVVSTFANWALLVMTKSSWWQWRDFGCVQDSQWCSFVSKNVLVIHKFCDMRRVQAFSGHSCLSEAVRPGFLISSNSSVAVPK